VNLPQGSYPSDKNDPDSNPSALQFEKAFSARLRNSPGILDAGETSVIPQPVIATPSGL
jgi:hypothetical protein